LGLGAEARINKPATSRGNWKWRLRAQPPRLRQKARAPGETLREINT
jgi:4-alpha-glucanotransferase